MRNAVAKTNTYAAPTTKQIAYAESLARQAGYRYGINEARRAKTGKNPVGDITRQNLSDLIDWLQDRIDDEDN